MFKTVGVSVRETPPDSPGKGVETKRPAFRHQPLFKVQSARISGRHRNPFSLLILIAGRIIDYDKARNHSESMSIWPQGSPIRRGTPHWVFFECPACRLRLRVHLSFSHEVGPCPACGILVRAPRLAAPPTPGGAN